MDEGDSTANFTPGPSDVVVALGGRPPVPRGGEGVLDATVVLPEDLQGHDDRVTGVDEQLSEFS